MKTIKFTLIKNHFVVGLAVACLMFIGCAGSSILKPYPSQMDTIKSCIVQNDLDKSYSDLSKKTDSPDKILWLQERGHVACFQNKYDESIADFEEAIRISEEKRMQAIISASDTAAQAASLLTNDNVIPYKGCAYERVFLHTFQAMNYLAQGHLEDALVEVRAADEEQRFSLEEHDAEIHQATKNEEKYKINRTEQEGRLAEAYAAMQIAAGKVENSFQNAFTFYLSGVIREMGGGEEGEAFIDYQKAWKIYPENTYLIKDLLRRARSDNRAEDLERFSKLYKDIKPDELNNDQGRLVIIFEEDFVPPKRQIKFPLVIKEKSYTIAMPYYDFEWTDPSPLRIYDGDQLLGETETICLVKALAVKDLKERYWGIFLRQLLRLVAKDQIQREIQKKTGGNSLAKIGMWAGDFIMTNADLRSWLTLPDNIQIASFYLPQGEHNVGYVNGSGGKENIDIEIKPGQITLLRIAKLQETYFVSLANQISQAQMAKK